MVSFIKDHNFFLLSSSNKTDTQDKTVQLAEQIHSETGKAKKIIVSRHAITRRRGGKGLKRSLSKTKLKPGITLLLFEE